MRHTAYNLSIESQLILPELLPDPEPASAADVQIKFAAVPPDGLPKLATPTPMPNPSGHPA